MQSFRRTKDLRPPMAMAIGPDQLSIVWRSFLSAKLRCFWCRPELQRTLSARTSRSLRGNDLRQFQTPAHMAGRHTARKCKCPARLSNQIWLTQLTENGIRWSEHATSTWRLRFTPLRQKVQTESHSTSPPCRSFRHRTGAGVEAEAGTCACTPTRAFAALAIIARIADRYRAAILRGG